MVPFDVVLLAGGFTSLHPLTEGGIPSCLVPLCNTPMLALAARLLERNAVRLAHVVCQGSAVAARVAEWVTANQGDLKTALQVVTVSDTCGSAEALRAVLPRLLSDVVVVAPVHLITSLSLQEVALTHWAARAAATVVLAPRRTLASTETKLGRPPKGVDYVGLSSDKSQLLYMAHCPETQRDVKLPFTMLMAASTMTLTTRLQDTHLYVLQRAVLASILAEHPGWQCLATQVVPHIIAHQVRLPDGEGFASVKSTSASLTLDAPSCTAEQFADLNHAPPRGLGAQLGVAGVQGWVVVAHVVPDDLFCRPVANVQAYAEVSREVTAPGVAEVVFGSVPELHSTVSVGNKTSVAPGCVVGRGSVLGQKCSAKRTVVGAGCRIGNNVKLINSVVMDDVTVEDGCHIQNSVLCAGSVVHAGGSLKDCTVGPGYVVAEGLDLKDEVLTVAGVGGSM